MKFSILRKENKIFNFEFFFKYFMSYRNILIIYSWNIIGESILEIKAKTKICYIEMSIETYLLNYNN